MNTMHCWRRIVVLGVSISSLVAAACGDEGLDDRAAKVAATTTSSSTTTTVPPPVGKVERIVSLSPTATETLFAIGAGPQVVAVDRFSTFPLEAPIAELSATADDLEAIAAYQPDLVITDGTDQGLLDALNDRGIAALAAPVPRSLNGALEQIETIGAGTGNIASAAALVMRLEAEILAIKASMPDREGTLRYYLELDPSYATASSKTFIGAVLAELGLENIADPLDTSRNEGYPRLSDEFIVDADPDVILLADTTCCQQTPETVAARPGWDRIRAVADGYIVALDGDVASRWGPRTVDLLRQVASAVAAVRPRLDDSLTDS